MLLAHSTGAIFAGALATLLLCANAFHGVAVDATKLPFGAQVHGPNHNVMSAPVGGPDINRRVENLVLRLSATEPTRVMSNEGGWQSVKHMHRRGFPELEELRRHMEEAALGFLSLPDVAPQGGAPRGLLGAPTFQVTDCWINVADAGGETYWHTHVTDSRAALRAALAPPLVGVYYAAVGNSGPSRILLSGRRGVEFGVTPQRGLAVFLPAQMPHAVEPHRNLTHEQVGPRISVTFNLTPRWFASDVHRAAHHGDLAELERLVRTKEGADERDTSRDGKGRPLLLTAVEAGHAPVVARLLDLRADVHATRPNGQGVMTGVSAPAGDTSELAAMLLAARAAPSESATDGSRPLHHAVTRGSQALVELLLRHGDQADGQNAAGQEPLHKAAFFGRTRVAALLLEHRAALRTVDSDGRLPFHRAADEGNVEVVKLLADRDRGLPWVPVTGRRVRDAGDLPVHLSAQRGYVSVVEELGGLPGMLLARGAKNQTLLHSAVRRPRTHVMAWLLERRADVSATDDKGWEPLHLAAKHGHASAVELLLGAGADPCGTTASGEAPASLAGNTTAAASLLRERCAAQVARSRGDSPGRLRGLIQAYALSTRGCGGADTQLV